MEPFSRDQLTLPSARKSTVDMVEVRHEK